MTDFMSGQLFFAEDYLLSSLFIYRLAVLV